MNLNCFRAAALLLVATVFAQTATAQKPKKKDPDVQVIDFGNDKSDDKKDDKAYKGMIIKTSPTSYIFGRQMVELEKEMNDNLSLQFGLGATFAPIWSNYAELVAEINDDGGYCGSQLWTADECDYYQDYSIRRGGGAGILASISPRLFWESEGYEGMYIAPILRYSINRWDVQKASEGLTYLERDTQKWQAEREKNFDLMVHYGAQYLYPKWTAESFVGLGVRFSNNERQDLGYDVNGTIQNGERSFKSKNFRFEVGLRVGFQL